jgi:4-diphosphocytidyl-2C-methyl-D-erythritol kinase
MHISTPAVYKEFDRLELGDQVRLDREPDWNAWAALPVDKLLPNLVNDLEAPAFVICPELDRLRVRIETFVGRPVRMSGSGSSLFTLYDAQAEAAAAAQRVVERFSVRAMGVEIATALVDDASDEGPVG